MNNKVIFDLLQNPCKKSLVKLFLFRSFEAGSMCCTFQKYHRSSSTIIAKQSVQMHARTRADGG